MIPGFSPHHRQACVNAQCPQHYPPGPVSFKCQSYGQADHTPCAGTTDDGTERNCECWCHHRLEAALAITRAQMREAGIAAGIPGEAMEQLLGPGLVLIDDPHKRVTLRLVIDDGDCFSEPKS